MVFLNYYTLSFVKLLRCNWYLLTFILINIKANVWKESGNYQVDVDSLENLISTGFLSSPFSYRLLYKNHKRPDSCSYDPFRPPKIRRKRDQHRRAGSHNLNFISLQFFLLLHVFVRGKTGPTSLRDPVRFLVGPGEGPGELKNSRPRRVSQCPLRHMSLASWRPRFRAPPSRARAYVSRIWYSRNKWHRRTSV